MNEMIKYQHIHLKKRPPFVWEVNWVQDRTVTDFFKDLVERDAFKYPHTYKRALQLVEAAGQDVKLCLQLALSTFKLFPAIVFWDENRLSKAKWNRDFTELYSETEMPSSEALAATLMGDICSAMERGNLTYGKYLQRYKERGMPWLHPCLQRLPKNLTKDQKISILTFFKFNRIHSEWGFCFIFIIWVPHEMTI